VVPTLPSSVQAEARRRLQAAVSLTPIEPSLVHGDLGGANLHWDETGELVGVLDWDLAQPFDPAYDAACLAQHGWHNVEQAVDPLVCQRARVWAQVFCLEQVGAALLSAEPPEVLAFFISGAVQALGVEQEK
jgi:aminoglycoside phosphotransferase (APT) family kinase protein